MQWEVSANRLLTASWVAYQDSRLGSCSGGLESPSPAFCWVFYYGVLDGLCLNVVTAVRLHVLRSRWSSGRENISHFRIDLLGRIDANLDRTEETGMYGHH